MPELPEVEALADYLHQEMIGAEVEAVEVVAFSALKTFAPPPGDLVGRVVTGVARRGKFVDIECSGLHLVVHLARAGWVRWAEAAPASPARPGKGPLALRLRVSGGRSADFTEAGTRKRLALYVVTDPELVPGVARLGVDPLDPRLTLGAFTEILAKGAGRIKGVLTDQSLLAGIGNAYSDEALHRARLSPFKTASRLSPEEVGRLHEALLGCLTEAVIRSRGRPARGLKDEKRAGMQVHGRTGLPCPVCGDAIRQVAYSDKSLQYCATCQTGGKPLADRRLSRLLK